MPPQASATFTTFTLNSGAEYPGEIGDCAAKQREKNMRPVLRMKAREYTTDDGTDVYCSDVRRGVLCPHTGEFVSITDTCTGCEKIYKDGPFYLYCIRGSSTKVNENE